MNTTAPRGSSQGTRAGELLEQLSDVDPADAPPIADELARILAADQESAAPEQLEAEFSSEVQS
jgi:hypothetical protein